MIALFQRPTVPILGLVQVATTREFRVGTCKVEGPTHQNVVREKGTWRSPRFAGAFIYIPSTAAQRASILAMLSHMGSRRVAGEQRYQSWVEKIKRIERETTDLFWDRNVFRAVRKMFRTNPGLRKEGNEIFRWIATLYGRNAVMAVRRELDGQPRVISLYHLLHEMEDQGMSRVLLKIVIAAATG